MKIAGIIGGIGPASTVDYYRRLLAAYRAQHPDGRAPSILINSIDPAVGQAIAGDRLDEAADTLSAAIERLARAGADVGVIAAVTPHILFDELRRRAAMPLISIIEATAAASRAAGFVRLGLFGTRPTMRAEAFRLRFAEQGLTLIAPPAAEQAYIHRAYVTELLEGRIVPETRAELVRIALAMRARDRLDALVLGGTELPLLLDAAHYGDLPVLDATAIHIRALVDWLLA